MGKIGIALVFLLLPAVALGDLIVIPPSATTGLLGGLAQFHCNISFGASTQTMTWEYNNKIIYSFLYGVEDYPTKDTNKYYVRKDKDTFTLTVNDLMYIDGGIYACHGFTQQASATLIVLGEPVLIPPPLTPVKGETAEFICKANFGGPCADGIEDLPHLRMLVDDINLKNSSEMSRLTAAGCIYELRQVQNITVEARWHGKRLTCELGISRTGTNYTADLIMNVHYPVRNIRYSPKNDSYEVGSQIFCSADGNPSPSFEWRNLADTERIFTESVLIITEDMTGSNKWKCIARNLIRNKLYEESVIADIEIGALENKEAWPEKTTRAVENKEALSEKTKPSITVYILAGILIFFVLPYLLGIAVILYWKRTQMKRTTEPKPGSQGDIVLTGFEYNLNIDGRSGTIMLEQRGQGEMDLTGFVVNAKQKA